jgi:hypothetical protein
MRYALLIYRGSFPAAGSEAWNALPDAEKKALTAEYVAFNQIPGVEAGFPLGMPEEARTVWVLNGEVESQPGSYFPEGITSIKFVEADSLEAAVAVAAKIPAARLGGAVEVRKVEVRKVERYW